MASDLPDTTFAVLGLLAKTASSGYDLAALADRSLGYFWPISRTLVYRELRRLESLGWICGEQVPQERLPDKRVWTTTPEGRHALAGWVAQPALAGGADRNGFLLKFFLGTRMPPKARLALLADYRQSLEATRAALAALIERLSGMPNARMGRLSALHGLRTAEARLLWIDEVEAQLAKPAEPQPDDNADPHGESRTRSGGLRRIPASGGASHRRTTTN